MDDVYAEPDDAPWSYPRAAIAVWVSAGLLLVVSSCCVGISATFSAVSLAELQQMPGMEEVPEETWDQMRQVQPYMAGVAIATALLALLPALVLLVLGFGIRRGQRGSAKAALFLCWIPFGLVVINVVLALPAVGSTGVAGVLTLLPWLTLGGTLFWAIRSLRQALREDAPDPDDPWGQTYDTPPGDDPWERRL